MPAHRSALSQRAPRPVDRPVAGGRHRSRGGGSGLPRASALGATGLAATVVLGLGLGGATTLAADATPVPAAVHAAVRAAVVPAAVVPAAARPAAVIHGGLITAPLIVHPVRVAPAAVAVSTLGMRAVRLAATRAGDPYVYGAEGPRAFDCSGLVQWVYDHLHRELPRTAGAQYDATRHISHSRARAGDLIFFASYGRIYHVAIYAGHGWIWAAPYPGKDVEKEKLWTNDYLVGRVR